MAAKKTAQSYGDKMEFVMGLPGVPAKDVVARAKLAGIEISIPYVYTIRGLDRQRPDETAAAMADTAARPEPSRKGSSAAVPATAAKATLPEQSRKGGSAKRDFVQSLSPDVPVAEVVRRAAEAGITLSHGYVYQIRSDIGASKPRSNINASKPAASPASKPVTKPDLTSQLLAIESEFVRRVLDLGLVRSTEILERLQRHLLA